MAAAAAVAVAAVMHQWRPQGGPLRGPLTPVSTAGRTLLQVKGIFFVQLMTLEKAEVFGPDAQKMPIRP
jgi:hypothetical protein